MGYDAFQVGGFLAKEWGLSTLVEYSIRFMQNPSLAEEHKKTTSIIAAANSLAYRIGVPNNSFHPDEGFNDDVLETVGIPEEQYDAIGSVVAGEVNKAEFALQIR